MLRRMTAMDLVNLHVHLRHQVTADVAADHFHWVFAFAVAAHGCCLLVGGVECSLLEPVAMQKIGNRRARFKNDFLHRRQQRFLLLLAEMLSLALSLASDSLSCLNCALVLAMMCERCWLVGVLSRRKNIRRFTDTK